MKEIKLYINGDTMKKLLSVTILTIFILSAFIFANATYSQGNNIDLQIIPSGITKFSKMQKKEAKTPEGGVAMFIAAMVLYGDNNEKGLRCFIYALDRELLEKSKNGYKGYLPIPTYLNYIKELNSRKYLGKTYIQQTESKNGYSLPPKPYKIEFEKKVDVKDDEVQFYIKNTGGVPPRTITVRKNTKGIWKVSDASNFFADVKDIPPKQKQKEVDEL